MTAHPTSSSWRVTLPSSSSINAGAFPGARRALWPLIVALAGALVYANTLRHDFVLDDIPLVRDNSEHHSLRELAALWLEPYWPVEQGGEASGLYRPVTILSFILNRAWTGPGPAGFHAVNVMLHACVCWMAWQASRRASTYYGTALLSGLLFAVHPIHVEAVAPVTGRAELLGAFFVLAAWQAHRWALAGRRTTATALRMAAAALLYLLALLSKENTLLAPLLFLVDDRWERRQAQGSDALRRAAVFGAYVLALCGALMLRAQALGGLFRGAQDRAFIDNPAAAAGAWTRLATALWVQVKYAWLLIWPLQLSSDYSFDAIPLVRSAQDVRFWIGCIWLLTLLAAFVWSLRHSRTLALAMALWLLFLLPSSNLFFPSGTIMAERLTYLASLGGCLALGHAAARALALWPGAFRRRSPQLAALFSIAALCLGLLAWRTTRRNTVWRDNLTLALNDSQVTPRSAKLHAGAGIALHARGNLEAARAAYGRALEIYPEYAQIHFNLGQLMLDRHEAAQALQHLRQASQLSPENPRPYKSLAPLLEQAGRLDEALAAYAAGSSLDPFDHALRFNHGRLLLAAGRKAEARRVLAQLARDDAQGLPGHAARALLHEIEGRAREAEAIYRELLARQDVPAAIRDNMERRLRALAGVRGATQPAGEREEVPR